jgi:hypothetical protein
VTSFLIEALNRSSDAPREYLSGWQGWFTPADPLQETDFEKLVDHSTLVFYYRRNTGKEVIQKI